MADTKITGLTADTAPATTDVTVTIDDTAGTPVTKKVTWLDVFKTLLGGWSALGDLVYGGASGAPTKLTGNTTTTKKFLRQTGDGAASAAPAWDTVTKSDVGLGNVENTALSTWAGSSNITTLGTITTGVWNGTAVPVANGGTGSTTAANARTALGLGTVATKDYTETSEQALGSITWTGSAAPTSLTSANCRAVQIGNLVIVTGRIEYASAGTSLTKAVFDLPAGLPAPASPTGQSANELGWAGSGNLSTSMTGTSSTRVNMYRNAGDTGWEIAMEAASGNYTGGVWAITYTTF